MKEVLNEAMKQDFSSHAVLGRVLFGVSFLMLGLYSIVNMRSLASYAPSFVPEFLAPIVVLLVGAIFAGAGAGVATGKAIARGATAIALVWASMAIFTNVLNMYFDVREFFIALAFIGAAMVIKAYAQGDHVTQASVRADESDAHTSSDTQQHI